MVDADVDEVLTFQQKLIHLDYRESHKDQNEIQNSYKAHNNKSFRLFTTCTSHQKGNLPITITTEESVKPRVPLLSCVNKSSPIHWKNSTNKSKLCMGSICK